MIVAFFSHPTGLTFKNDFIPITGLDALIYFNFLSMSASIWYELYYEYNIYRN